MLVLVGCEESQIVTQAFRAKGHQAFSCDIKPTRGDTSIHYQDDIMNVITAKQWDLIILHPDCTSMALSGNRWYGADMPHHKKRLDAIEWTKRLWCLATYQSPRVVLENPASVIFQHLNAEQVQYIQPWQFGHGETKKTGLALQGVPLLKPENIVTGREQRVWKMPPGVNRKRDRSQTFPGIASAFANQWSIQD